MHLALCKAQYMPKFWGTFSVLTVPYTTFNSVLEQMGVSSKGRYLNKLPISSYRDLAFF